MATAETIPKSTVQAQEQCYTRKDFVKAWSFPLQPLHDFKLNGEPAQYAPGYPKVPGDEKVTIDSEDAIESEHQEHLWESPTAAISPDKKLLAVTSNHERILVYDLESQQLRQVLDGAGDVVFCPPIQSDEKATEGRLAESSTKPAYICLQHARQRQ
ncbi:Cellobionic acid phosphorylase [Ascochyta rabiei]|uniref:Cellobionic acid phosphorylase n=1 Tax=Didymella rabiei TaxID=5454 RepID=UPI00220F9B31|nr:Cellobionic acid phosphorylase [Ascochyta rabiei]UPX16886.1 Cellobionic acid phosphorylase [Ascochyta rabiei]